MNTADLQIGLNPSIGIDIAVLLNLLNRTTAKYMEAFEISPDTIKMCNEIQTQYQGFKKITAYYMNNKNECISFVIFTFDWNKYELIYETDDPDILMKRKSILAASPEQILEETCKTINEKVKDMKIKRNYKYIRMVYTYSDKVQNNTQLIESIRKKGNFASFNEKSIKYSKELEGYKTYIESSITENTLSISFVM